MLAMFAEVAYMRFTLSLLLFVLAYPLATDAQNDDIFDCHSKGNARTECRAPFHGRAELVMNLASTACVEGENWGWAPGSVWVSGGCSGRFGFNRSLRGAYIHPPAPPATATPPTQVVEADAGVECRSRSYRHQRCPVPPSWRAARVEKQLSRSECKEGDSWGLDDQGLWVDKGCHARFAQAQRSDSLIRHGRGAAGIPAHQPSPAVPALALVECRSERRRLQRCQAPQAWRGAELHTQLSSTRCVEGDNWGFDAQGLWVNAGCAGQFVEAAAPAQLELLRCESRSEAYQHCAANVRRARVVLHQQVSRTRCEEGRNWGTDRRGVWVNHGCRGVFAIQQ